MYPFVPLLCGNFVIMSTKLRFYVGETLAVDDATSASSLSYLALCVYLPLQVQLVTSP